MKKRITESQKASQEFIVNNKYLWLFFMYCISFTIGVLVDDLLSTFVWDKSLYGHILVKYIFPIGFSIGISIFTYFVAKSNLSVNDE